jgi:hypothetical protein
MPVDFVSHSKLVFLRLEAATELQSMLEVRLRSRFIVLLIGPSEHSNQLYEVGRAISTCLADDVRYYYKNFYLQNYFNLE